MECGQVTLLFLQAELLILCHFYLYSFSFWDKDLYMYTYMMLFTATISLSGVLCHGHMQNTVRCLLNIECSPLAIRSKALRSTLHLCSVWMFLHVLRAAWMNSLSLHTIQKQEVNSSAFWVFFQCLNEERLQ